MNSHLPLVVDLDGTLIKTDLLFESLLKLIKRNIFFIFLIPFWAIRGYAYLKSKIAEHITLNVEILPYRKKLLDFLIRQKKEGRKLVLATAANYKYAEQIVNHLSIFDRFFASDSKVNLISSTKSALLVKKYGKKGFDYIGDSKDDLRVLSDAASGILLTHNTRLLKKAKSVCNLHNSIIKIEKKNRKKIILSSLRIHQWVKNVLLFVPLLLVHKYYDHTLILKVTSAFIAFGLCASSGYLFNDLFDIDNDREHRVKNKRAIASGDLSVPDAVIIMFLSLLAGLSIGCFISSEFVSILSIYYITTISYSIYLKRIPLIDTLILSGLYTLRIIAGAYLIYVKPSFWLLCFSIFLFFSLAILKRFVELSLMDNTDKPIGTGRGYDIKDIDFLHSAGLSTGYISVLVVGLYIDSDDAFIAYSNPRLLWILCPILLYSISHLWFTANRGAMDEDPIKFMITDKISLISISLSIAIILLAV